MSRGRGVCASNCAHAIAIMEEKRNLPPEEGGLKPVPGARKKRPTTARVSSEHYIKSFMNKVNPKPPPVPQDVESEFIHPCAGLRIQQNAQGDEPDEEGR